MHIFKVIHPSSLFLCVPSIIPSPVLFFLIIQQHFKTFFNFNF